MLERQHLQILKAIALKGTVTEAATDLFLTQSALSHAIKKLEKQFDVKVWHKEGRRVRLTQAGELLLGFANRVVPQFEHIELRLQQIAKGERGILRIGMECHPCYQWLLKVVQPFMLNFPDIDIDVKQQFQFGALGALLEYDIDMIITPDPLQHKAISYQAVFDYEHVLAVCDTSVLATKNYIVPSDIANEVLISYPVEQNRLDIFNRFLTPAGASVKRHKIIETTEIIMQMVAANRGVAALPRWLIEVFQKDLNIVGVSLGKSTMMKSIYLGTRNTEKMPAYITSFKQLAEATSF
jgi:LysR family transcriptional regulator for metE and metH